MCTIVRYSFLYLSRFIREAFFDGIILDRKSLRTLNGRNWLDDTIVDFFLRYYCQLAERKRGGEKSFFPFSSIFHQKLLVNGSLKDRPVSLSSFNIHEVEEFAPTQMWKLKYIFVPICDRLHWWLFAYEVQTGYLYVLCSLGLQSHDVARSMKRYFMQVRQDQRWPEEIPQISEPIYPNVARQTNSHDCGVFVIEYARRITEGVHIGPDLVNGAAVQKRRPHLRKVIKSIAY